MESNNTIINHADFLNTYQNFPNNMATEFNSLISLNNTHTNYTDFNINNNLYLSNSNNLENTSLRATINQKTNINVNQSNEQIKYSTLTLSQNINFSLDNDKNKEDNEEEENEEELEENFNTEDILNYNNINNGNNEMEHVDSIFDEISNENIIQNANENENITLLNTFSNRNHNNFQYLNNQQENNINNNNNNNIIINKSAEINSEEFLKLNLNNEDSKYNLKLALPSNKNKSFENYSQFTKSPQYPDFKKALFHADKLFALKGENTFEVGTEEGNEICQDFLNQIEVLMKSMNIKGKDRTYRKKFTKAYYLLFEEDKLCFLSEIFDSAQENTNYIMVNDSKYYFSEDVLNYGNELYISFCALITLLTDINKLIKDKIKIIDINRILDNIKSCLIDFDSKWVQYEEIYINELIIIEEKARKLILEGIKLENDITNYENKSKIKGKLLINDKKYNELRSKLIGNILEINRIANVNGKGRSDLSPEILFQAEKVLVTVSENQSKGMRNLALKIKNGLNVMRQLFRKFSKNIESVDPRLSNNKDLSKYLLYFERKFELGKIYLLDNKKYNQLLAFSQIIEIICEKYNKYSIRELIENNDPCIFVSLPSILLLKAINKEDKNICKEYITGLYDKNNESGILFQNLKNMKKQVKGIIGDSNKAYNIIEKYVLFDGTKEQLMVDKEIEKYSKLKEIISEIKKGLTNLSVHLQTYKPTQWNEFFQLAMDIKILTQNEMFNEANKTISVDDNNYNEYENENENDSYDNNESINEEIE